MENLLVHVEEGVMHVTFNAPERRNPLTIELRAPLRAALRAGAADPAVRCIVLTGAGGHFMAGGDISVFSRALEMAPDERRGFFEERIHGLGPVIDQMRDTPKPIIAKLRGASAGVGVALALACDLAYAAEDAFFATAYVHLATAPDGGLSWLLPRAVGSRKAMELLMLADRLPAPEALRLGMLNGVVPEGELDATVDKVAKRLARAPAQSIAAIKKLVLQAPDVSLERQMSDERRAFSSLSLTKDFAEGVNAFMEKRRANFSGE